MWCSKQAAVVGDRSKFLNCLAGAVLNSYANVDLLWDNVIAGPWGDGPAYGASEAPTRPYPSAGRERLRYLNRVNFLMAATR
jgi:hypothetical protein